MKYINISASCSYNREYSFVIKVTHAYIPAVSVSVARCSSNTRRAQRTISVRLACGACGLRVTYTIDEMGLEDIFSPKHTTITNARTYA